MKIKQGDVIEFISINYEDGWDFDSPTYIIEPFQIYNDSISSASAFIENVCIDIISELDVEKSYIYGKPTDRFLKTLKTVCNERLNKIENKWKSKNVFVCKRAVEFYLNEDKCLSFRTISEINC